uniref:phosphatidylserine decarboxylase n=1 Tax=Acrobeloides nanus TaxID=290746 RepID=A0A914D382_9BILA
MEIPIIHCMLNNYNLLIFGIFISSIIFLLFPKFNNYTYIVFPSLSVPYTHFIGKLTRIHVPVFLRTFVYSTYVWYHGVNMKEAANEDYKAYESIGEFFSRPLKPGVRPVDDCSLVSPVDGKVIQFGELVDKIEQVKGYDYEFEEFLGPIDPNHKPGNKLYQVVIFLRPTDYHCFHSPANWEADTKIEHSGLMLPFKIHQWVSHWFSTNVRVCLIGKWKHGFFSMSPVATSTVGDIVIDPGRDESDASVREKTHKYTIYDQKFKYMRGNKVGEFHAGSMCVLIFEAPPHLKFCIKPGQLIHYGMRLLATEP